MKTEINITEHISLLPTSNEIILNGQNSQNRISIENQLMKILVLLWQNEGEVVQRSTFVKHVWQGNELVGREALTKNISRLRKVLAANDLDSILEIETVPKKGYKLRIVRPVIGKRRPPISLSRIISLTLVALLLALFAIAIFDGKKIEEEEIIVLDLSAGTDQ